MSLRMTDSSSRESRPSAAEGLQPAYLRPLLKSQDREAAALAGYLLALLGDSKGLATLVDYWHQQQDRQDPWTPLVYRAIAATGDPDFVPLLRSIYEGLDRLDRGEFPTSIGRSAG